MSSAEREPDSPPQMGDTRLRSLSTIAATLALLGVMAVQIGYQRSAGLARVGIAGGGSLAYLGGVAVFMRGYGAERFRELLNLARELP